MSTRPDDPTAPEVIACSDPATVFVIESVAPFGPHAVPSDPKDDKASDEPD